VASLKPSRKAKEIADAEEEMQFNHGKKKGVSTRDAHFAGDFDLDQD